MKIGTEFDTVGTELSEQFVRAFRAYDIKPLRARAHIVSSLVTSSALQLVISKSSAVGESDKPLGEGEPNNDPDSGIKSFISDFVERAGICLHDEGQQKNNEVTYNGTKLTCDVSMSRKEGDQTPSVHDVFEALEGMIQEKRKQRLLKPMQSVGQWAAAER